MNTEEKINHLAKEAKTVTLSDFEKDQIRLNLMQFMKENPAQDASLPKEQNWYATFINNFSSKPALKYSFLSALVLLMSGAGVSFAAQNALPGDLLYSVKTQVNERVLAFTLFSDELKTRNDLNLIQLRLQETEKISAENKFDAKKSAQVNVLLNQHIADVKARIEKMKEKGSPDIAIETNSELQASLNAHTQVLDQLSHKTQGVNKDNIKKIISEVKLKTQQAVQDKEKEALKLSAQAKAKSQVLAEAKLAKASAAVVELSQFIEFQKPNISVAMYQTAKADVNIANDYLLEGKVKLEAEDYNNAFILFQEAVSKAQEIKIYIASSAALNLKLHPNQIQINANEKVLGETQSSGVVDAKANIEANIKGILK